MYYDHETNTWRNQTFRQWLRGQLVDMLHTLIFLALLPFAFLIAGVLAWGYAVLWGGGAYITLMGIASLLYWLGFRGTTPWP